MTLSALGIFSAAGAGGVFSSDYELIQTQIVSGSSTTAVTFDVSSFASTYKHLQVRFTARDTYNYAGGLVLRGTFNSSGSGYAWHQLNGTGSTITAASGINQSYLRAGIYAGGGFTSGHFAGGVIDILDFASTSKNKHLTSLCGSDGVTVYWMSGLWQNTNAITSFTLTCDVTAFTAGTRFSIYGSKG